MLADKMKRLTVVSCKTSDTLLELAAKNDIDGFTKLLNRDSISVDQVGLWYMCQKGSKQVVRDKRTPLMVAAMYGSLDVLRKILSLSRRDVNRSTGDDLKPRLSPLCCSCVSKNAGESLQRYPDLKQALHEILGLKDGVLHMKLNFESKREYHVDPSLPKIKNSTYSDKFMMYSFKVVPCSHVHFHIWEECPFFHPGESARRRDPHKYPYSCVPCPKFRKGTCRSGDLCEYAHGTFECGCIQLNIGLGYETIIEIHIVRKFLSLQELGSTSVDPWSRWSSSSGEPDLVVNKKEPDLSWVQSSSLSDQSSFSPNNNLSVTSYVPFRYPTTRCLDKQTFSWQQRIRLYCRGKDNGVNILKSIDEGPFQMGTTRGIIAEGTEGPINLDAKDIGTTVRFFLEGSELTKEDRESQLYDDFEHFRQNKGETIHNYYVRFAKLINDMRNIKMTMSKIQLNSKFMNNMLPEWGRFVTAVKLNKGLKDSNFDQLYAYLKQHETHANENKMMLERLTQQTVDPLALMSNVSPQLYHSQSSTNPPTTHHQPQSADSSQSELGLSPTDNLIENLTNTLALLTQSYKTFLPQTNNQLRTSSNPRNQATVPDGRVEVKCSSTEQEHELRILQRPRWLLMQAQGNGVALDEEQLLFLAGGQDYAIDEDVDEQPVQDLALNVDNVFQADDCDCERF
ncbi:retrovirus-related pol polyprotein from transposon TNT 1-94 [Tanacetum coccineum]|uniref:Retrovirus-related pol polyprotein from transposon TNT 1-94 n=1 Tax=Tanacetum coccineum TaxID=301880 RepID=A0ABQ5AHH8_9ASTR